MAATTTARDTKQSGEDVLAQDFDLPVAASTTVQYGGSDARAASLAFLAASRRSGSASRSWVATSPA